jgi:hypothetical protein
VNSSRPGRKGFTQSGGRCCGCRFMIKLPAHIAKMLKRRHRRRFITTDEGGNHLRNYLDDGLLAVGDLHANKHPCIVITHHHHRVVIGQQLYEWPTGPAHAATDNELLSCRMVVNLCL